MLVSPSPSEKNNSQMLSWEAHLAQGSPWRLHAESRASRTLLLSSRLGRAGGQGLRALRPGLLKGAPGGIPEPGITQKASGMHPWNAPSPPTPQWAPATLTTPAVQEPGPRQPRACRRLSHLSGTQSLGKPSPRTDSSPPLTQPGHSPVQAEMAASGSGSAPVRPAQLLSPPPSLPPDSIIKHLK